MASLTAIREAMAENLSSISGMQVSPYLLSNPTPPAAHIFPSPTDPIDFDKTMQRGHDDVVLIVQVFVALTGDIGPQKVLDQYLAGSGSKSFKAALESDPTLNGESDDLRVTGVTAYQRYVLPTGGEVLAADLRVEVLATGE